MSDFRQWWVDNMHSLPLHDNEALAKCAWQAARQSGEVEPVGYVSGEALENLKRGHPVHAYAPDTPLVFGSKVWIYTHPPAPTQGVPSPCPYCEGRGGTGEDWCVACDATGLKRPEPPKDNTQEGE